MKREEKMAREKEMAIKEEKMEVKV